MCTNVPQYLEIVVMGLELLDNVCQASTAHTVLVADAQTDGHAIGIQTLVEKELKAPYNRYPEKRSKIGEKVSTKVARSSLHQSGRVISTSKWLSHLYAKVDRSSLCLFVIHFMWPISAS